jgi:hypothetical protein
VELLTEVDVLALDLGVAMRVLQRDGGLGRQQRESPIRDGVKMWEARGSSK